MDDVTQEKLTFEQGYEELKTIVERLDEQGVSVHEMFEGFRRGKGLEKALRGYLTEREGELEEIEEGKNLPEFEIVPPPVESSSPAASKARVEDRDFQPAPVPGIVPGGEEDIPF
jgi:exodeoxyribonuclease VII small subunit